MPFKIFAKSGEAGQGNWLKHVRGRPGVDEAPSLGAGGWGGWCIRKTRYSDWCTWGFRLMLVVHENKKGSRVGVG